MTNRPAWTLTEAVQRTGVSRSTLRRYLDAGKFPNAYKDISKAWRFPIEDLLAAGLSVSEPPTERALSAPTEQVSIAMAEQVSKLEQALRAERVRAENAERLATSYLENVQDLRRALRMLEAGTHNPELSTDRAQSMSSEQSSAEPALIIEPTVSRSEQTPAAGGQTSTQTMREGRQSEPLWRRLLSRR